MSQVYVNKLLNTGFNKCLKISIRRLFSPDVLVFVSEPLERQFF
jgi:hypothetical protein